MNQFIGSKLILLELYMFDGEFEVFLADDTKSKRIHFNIRYQVYCEDKKFEDASQFPDGFEMDDYDQKDAVHFIVRNRCSGEWVAAMRLVLNDNCQLPVLSKCELNPDFDVINQRVIEISRLCILKKYRGGTQPKVKDQNSHLRDENDSGVIRSDVRSNRGQDILMGLIRTAYQYGQHNHVYFGIALMTRSLARILRLIGLNVNPVGSCCEFNGKRYPFRFDLMNVVSDLIRMPKKLQVFFVDGPLYKSYSQENSGRWLIADIK